MKLNMTGLHLGALKDDCVPAPGRGRKISATQFAGPPAEGRVGEGATPAELAVL